MGGQEDQNRNGLAPGMPPAQAGFTPLFVALSPAELGARLPQFEVLELLGQGGMGAVYKARQPRLDRFVAIKLLPPLLDEDVHSFGKRFEREARAMAQLNHPNIVTVHDFGETEDGLRYFVMEYVDGTDLHKAIASRKVTAAHVLAWAPQICAGLSYAHGQHLVHRDIKPANILISKEGQVKVGDFGLAKLVGASRDMSLTQSQVSMGTPDYAAPEAMRAGANVDQRADIYSFGVVLYEMLTGVVPRGAWKAPSALCPVDPRLDRIVIKAMQPDREHRYQRMAQIAESLEEVKRNPEPPAAEPILKAVPVPEPVTTRKRTHPATVAFVALASAAAVVAGILYGASFYSKSNGGKPIFLLSPLPAPVSPRPGTGGPVEPTAPQKVAEGSKGAAGGIKAAVPDPSPETQKPPEVKDGWVSLQSASGSGVEPPGQGWAASLDDLVYNGKGRSGVGLDREGNLLPWGVFAAFPGMPGKVMQLRPAGVGVVALGTDGIPVYLTASPLPPGLSVGQPVQDIQFGFQEETGAIVRTPDGRLQTGGSFAALAKDLDALTKNSVVRRVEAGDQGIALQTQDNGWRFLGAGFDSDLEKKLSGCSRVLVSRTFVAGLLPE